MAITHVEIIEGCIACGLCSDMCPEVFEMEDLATVKEGVNYSDYEEGIKESADGCPTEVIKYNEEG